MRRVLFSSAGLIYLFVPAIVLTGAVLREINVLVLLAGFMTWPLIYSWSAVAGSMRGITVRRNLPGGVFAGEAFQVGITITNSRRWGASRAVAVEDTIRREGGRGSQVGIHPSVLFSEIPPGASVSATYRGIIPRRGRYVFGALRASTEYPLGFVRGVLTVDRRERLMVYPRLGELTEQWQNIRHEQFFGGQRTRRQASLMEGDFFGLREWRPGDSRRWIHWRTTARRGDLCVRQFEQPRSQDVSIWLDLRLPRDPTPNDERHVERAISFASTMVARLCERGGSQLTLGLAGEQVTVARGTASRAFLQEAFELLALIEASSADRLQELIEQVRPTIRPHMLCLLVTTAALATERVRQVRETMVRGMTKRAPEFRCISVSRGELDRYFVS